MSYQTAHATVKRERGSASAYPCQNCGNPANDWAYTNDAGDLEQIDPRSGCRYADGVEFYVPLCRSCHKRFDLSHNPEHMAWKRAHMSRLAKEFPPSREDRSRAGKARAAAQAERYRTDPEYRKRKDAASAENAVKARSALAKKHLEDPELRSRQTEEMRSSRSKCSECGLESRPGSIGMHQKHTGHKGTETL